MPEGTIEDARNNSPGWGYLRVEDSSDCGETMQESADRLDPNKDNGLQYLVTNLANPELEPWNKILLYAYDSKKLGVLEKGDSVCFRLIQQTLNVEGLAVVYWAAEVTRRKK